MNGMDNAGIARVLREIGEYVQMDEGMSFRARAYMRAADAVEAMQESVAERYRARGAAGVLEIPGIGKGIAEVIGDLARTGKSRVHAELQRAAPVDLSELTAIEGLGPQKIKKLYRELGIATVAALETAARAGKIRALEGFGVKSEEKILRAIAFLKTASGRMPLGEALPLARGLVAILEAVSGVERVALAGSVRRWRETVGDIDVLVVARDSAPVMAAAARLPEVVEVIASGETKTSVRLKNGLQIDVRVVPVESYGAALNYFTGSKEHNIALRQIAQSKGWKLNEYGLFDGERRIAGATEEDLYAALGLPYIDPELREEGLDVFGVMPRLVGYRDLKGDLQVQTSWSDGAHSIADMAEAAMKCGLDYIAVTDHTRRLAMTGGLDEKRLFEQRREIDALNERLAGSGIDFRILKGSECDILKDGSLDLRDEALATLDVAGVSVHSYFNLPRAEQTERVIRAMKNPHADILFHPTARKINRRPAIDVDMARIIRAAKDTGTIMEIDAFPDRLDLKDEYIKDCVREGVKLAIDSDAHDKGHFSVLEYGIAQARRGRAAKADIINAWPVEVMLASLKGGRPHGTASTRP